MKTTAIILAAGQGSRMHSSTPKVLHTLAGEPMIRYSLDAVAGIGSELPVVVVGHEADAVRNYVGAGARFVTQEQQLGTGHAVRAAESLLAGNTDLVLVVNADLPLLTAQTLKSLVETQRANHGPVTILTSIADDARGFGRVIRKPDGSVQAIVEEAQASPEQLAIRELNVGVYCFKADWLWQALPRVPLSSKGEYYLTDTVGIAVDDGLAVQTIVLPDACEAIGINTRVHLAEVESAMRQRINTQHMLAGVTLVDPSTTYIESGVQIGQDTIVWPNTYLRGKTVIGERCSIGPNSIVVDTEIGKDCTVLSSVLEGALLEDHVGIGPFGHLRKGAHLAEGVHMGNFGEVKDSYLGPGTKMGHFSYIGNAHIGPDVNIGAGTITCNFDGVNKNPTDIGSGAFIGSDTMLVAPVKIGDGARTGAGSVVTHDVPPHEVVVGVPARPLRKTEKSD
jgi:bifunctional UDP-N-acetylglucosamine pyrophosphorylase/glucosamine-1-phosphate N-acetyltransferase